MTWGKGVTSFDFSFFHLENEVKIRRVYLNGFADGSGTVQQLRAWKNLNKVRS